MQRRGFKESETERERQVERSIMFLAAQELKTADSSSLSFIVPFIVSI